jgi:hypothetical protein
MQMLTRLGRLGLASLLFLVGIYAIYGFGAGYFQAVSVPTPLNVLASLALLGVLIWAVGRIGGGRGRDRRAPLEQVDPAAGVG